MRIFLIGYMGCGKSTIGKILAGKLKMAFIDFDKYIEEKEKKNIPDIFETEGEEKFRAMEKNYLRTMLEKDNAVISLGGGTPCFHNNMKLIKKSGISVYIEMESEALARRLICAKKKRPLIRGMNEVDLNYFIEANLKKRNVYYRQADYTVKYENQDKEEMADLIIALLKN